MSFKDNQPDLDAARQVVVPLELLQYSMLTSYVQDKKVSKILAPEPRLQKVTLEEMRGGGAGWREGGRKEGREREGVGGRGI